jgi:hypothetical protein
MKFFQKTRVAPAPVDVNAILRRKNETVNKFVEDNKTNLILLQVAYPEHALIRETLKVLKQIEVTQRS